MYKRILLAYDGSVEGRTALREGALLARQCGAEVFLLSVLVDTGTLLLPEAGLAGAFVRMEDDFTDILNEGVALQRSLVRGAAHQRQRPEVSGDEKRSPQAG